MTVSVLAILGVGLADPSLPVARADDAVVTRGDGCFEGCRVRTDASGHSAVDKLEAHLARMARSAAALEIDFDPVAWRELVGVACAAWREPGEAGMKLLLSRGPEDGSPLGLVTVAPLAPDVLRQRREGLRVVTLSRGTTADAFAGAPWLLGGVKTLSYAVNMAAQREARRRGADDVIFTSADGHVLEAPTSTVVWVDGHTLLTPPPGASGILASTTQALLFERAAAAGWSTGEADASVDDLHAAPSVWLVGTVRGPVEVVELDGKARLRDPGLDAEVRALCEF